MIILSLCTQRSYGRHNFSRKSVDHFCLSNLLHGVISLPARTSYDKRFSYKFVFRSTDFDKLPLKSIFNHISYIDNNVISHDFILTLFNSLTIYHIMIHTFNGFCALSLERLSGLNSYCIFRFMYKIIKYLSSSILVLYPFKLNELSYLYR